MLVARWHLTAQFGKVDDVVSILRKWEIDVGQRAGWKAGALRVTAGLVGAGNTDIELEARVDSLGDLEAAWSDMERNPHHREYLAHLGHVIVSGSARWTVHREINLIPDET
jgi:hypothetical protein